MWMRNIFALFMGIPIMMMGSLAQADPTFEHCTAAFQARNYSKALNLCMPVANKGHVKAQFILGYIYYTQKNNHSTSERNKSLLKARKWFEKAANQQHAISASNVGLMYLNGVGTKKNLKKAAKYFTIAAKYEDAKALLNLGKLFYLGHGVTQDYSKAYRYFLKAARQDQVEAQISIGGMYMRGKGVKKNLVKAYIWYNMATVTPNNNSRIKLLIRDAKRRQKALEKQMSAEQLTTAKKAIERLQNKGKSENFSK